MCKQLLELSLRRKALRQLHALYQQHHVHRSLLTSHIMEVSALAISQFLLMQTSNRSDRTSEASTSAGSHANEADTVAAAASGTLAQTLHSSGFRLSRLKTGTPPRLAADSIDYSNLELQPGDTNPLPFSFMHMDSPEWRYACTIMSEAASKWLLQPCIV